MKTCKSIIFIAVLTPLLLSGVQLLNAQCYELVWSEEFKYTGLPDSKIWNAEVGNNNGWGNAEKEYYKKDDADNSWVDGEYLTISALKETFSTFAYTSARLQTRGKAQFKYGKVEARMKLPYGQGIWPAFWMLGVTGTWPACGEIDIMELIGGSGDRDRTAYGTPHWADANGKHAMYGGDTTLTSGKFADDFHTFAVEWTATKIAWLMDGKQYHVMSTTPAALSEFQQPYYIILNLAVGGSWPGNPDATTVFPQNFIIDYVRVYQAADKNELQGNDTIVANNKGLTYSVKQLEGRTYLWSVPEGVKLLTKADSSAVSIDWGCASGKISCTVTTPCSTYVFTKNVVVRLPEIEGPMFFGKTTGDLTFSVPDMGSTQYKWTLPEGASFISSDTLNSAVVNWGSKNGTIDLHLFNPCLDAVVSKKVFSYGKYPYPDPEVAHSIPGTFNSTDFDYGGEGVGYHDTEKANQGTGPRTDEGVDTENQTSFSNVGWITTGEWLEYTIKVAQEGYYKVDMKTASANTSGIGPIRLLVNGEARVGDVTVASTGAWSTFKTVSQRLLHLYPTDTVLRIQAVGGGFNLGPVTLSVDNTVSVEEIKSEAANLDLFPNPVNDRLSIRLNIPTAGDVQVRVLDLVGKEVFVYETRLTNPGLQEIAITEQIRDLRPGMYMIKVNTPTEKYFSKFIKN
jgi:beta-glucanase (GH16 family)